MNSQEESNYFSPKEKGNVESNPFCMFSVYFSKVY
jgi:hypothetical protein